MKRIVVSDVHLGCKYSREDAFLSFLKNTQYDELILAGDIIDFIKIPQFSSKIVEILESINYSKEIYYIVGNHDISLKGFIGCKFFGVNFVSHRDFIDNGKRFHIEHGDRYDKPIVRNYLLMNIISVVQNFIENTFGVNISDWWTKRETTKRKHRDIWDIISLHFNYDVLIIGHFHTPEKVIWEGVNSRTVTYINSGDWVSHQTYVEIENGCAELKTYRY